MKRIVLVAATAAVIGATAVTAAVAGNIPSSAPGTPVYGPLATNPPAGEVAPTDAPPGYHYVWVYSYDHHGYRAHWEAIRNS